MEKQLTIMAAPKQSTSSKKNIIRVFIDGASRGNPGLSGAGIYIELNDKELLSKSVFLGNKTNNQAEYLALTLGIYFLKKELIKVNSDNIIITSDSELLVKQMKNEYKVKDATLKILKNIAITLLDDIKCKFTHVLRANNKKADNLANVAIDKKIDIPKEFSDILDKYGIKK